MGDSAGGNLVVTSMLKLLDDSKTLPGAGICYSPWLNLSTEPKGSALNNEGVDLIGARHIPKVVGKYLQGNLDLVDHHLVSPVCSKRLDELPPIFLSVGTSEVLLDNAMDFATLARIQGNNNIALHLTPYGYHCNYFFAMENQLQAVNLLKDTKNWLNNLYPETISRVPETNPVHEFLHQAFNP